MSDPSLSTVHLSQAIIVPLATRKINNECRQYRKGTEMAQMRNIQ